MATDWAAQLASYKKQYNTGDKSAAQRAQTLRQQAQAAGVDLNSLESQAMKLATGRDMTAEERGYANQYISKVKPPISTFTNPGLGDNGLGPLKGNEFWANMDNPEFQQAEVNRVNQVIANRKAQGLDTGQQESWLRQVTSHQPKVKPVVMGTPSPAMPLVITQQSTPRPAMAPGIAWQDALQRSRSQVDPLRQESIRNLMERYQQNRQETDQIAQARGGLHSGLIADQLTKLAQGLMQSQASINAKYDSDIARLAQTIQERNEDVNYRDWMAKNQFYDSDRNFGYQQQRDARRDFESDRGFGLQEAGLTGVYNGAPTLEAQNIRFNQGIQEGQLTGNYIPSAARDIITQILAAKQANATGGNAEAAAKANQLRAMLPQYGIDPSLFGADVTYEQALQNIGRAGQQTLAKQGQEFSQGIQMAQLTGFLPDGTPTNAYQQQQLANAWKEADAFGYVTPALSQLTGIPVGTETLQAKQIAIAQQNANTSAARAAAKASGSSETSGRGSIGTGTNLSSSERKELQKDALAYIQDMQDGKITPDQARQEINSYRSVYGDEYVDSLLAAIDDYAKQKDVESERNRIRVQQSLQDIIRRSVQNSQPEPYPGFSFPPLT